MQSVLAILKCGGLLLPSTRGHWVSQDMTCLRAQRPDRTGHNHQKEAVWSFCFFLKFKLVFVYNVIFLKMFSSKRHTLLYVDGAREKCALQTWGHIMSILSGLIWEQVILWEAPDTAYLAEKIFFSAQSSHNILQDILNALRFALFQEFMLMTNIAKYLTFVIPFFEGVVLATEYTKATGGVRSEHK